MQAAKRRTWRTAAAVAVLSVVATAWPAAAAPWPPADVAGVETVSPLLAPVDVELAPAPPTPAERAEITLALQPPRFWDGLLDLGIPSGESPGLSETRVWGFFLGSPDCVGLGRLQVPDSTGDASFFARSLRHGVYFARNNPVGFKDPNGRAAETVADVAFIAYDLFDIGRSIVRGEGVSGEQLTTLGLDGVGAMIPMVPGLGTGKKFLQGADKGAAGGQFIRRSGKFADGELFEAGLRSEAGNVTVLAETSISGKTLELGDLAIFADDGTSLANQIGP